MQRDPGDGLKGSHDTAGITAVTVAANLMIASDREAAMAKEIFEAFDGQQDTFGYSQATRAADTIYAAGTAGIGVRAGQFAGETDQLPEDKDGMTTHNGGTRT